MASAPTVPNDSSNRILQDKFNQDTSSYTQYLESLIKALEARIVALEA